MEVRNNPFCQEKVSVFSSDVHRGNTHLFSCSKPYLHSAPKTCNLWWREIHEKSFVFKEKK